MLARVRSAALLVLAITLTSCSDGTSPRFSQFLSGTLTDRGIALSISSSRNSLLLLQTGAPEKREEIPLGASSAVTPVGFSLRDGRVLIPLGNAASVAVADLENMRVERFFTFPSGNATGGAWFSSDVAIVCNQSDDYCGRFTTTQADAKITDTVHVTPVPNAVIIVGTRIFVVSSNLDETFTPAGNGVVTEIDPVTFDIVRTFTVGINPQFGALGPDGNLYVPNSGNYGMNDGTLSVIDLSDNTVETLSGFGDFPGTISIDQAGRAFISSFSIGTIAWDIHTRTFLRDPSNPLCAPITGGGCRGASSAGVAPNGNLYQAFFGSAFSNQPAYLFVYSGTTLALQDSIPMPLGPSALTIKSFDSFD